MFKIINKTSLTSLITKMIIAAPLASRNALAGQFVIIRSHKDSERIPLTIFEAKDGLISIIYQVVGYSTRLLDTLEVGDFLADLVGPLGEATDLTYGTRVIVIGGGLGCAIAYPLVKQMNKCNIDVTSIIGFRNKDLVILEDEFRSSSKEFYLTTDDGSKGEKGFVTTPLEKLLISGSYDVVYAVGPLVMMKNISLLTKKYKVKTIVSMNSIMVDGTGMCGGCRLSVAGKTKFACVDGPDFDGHLVDFDEAILRAKQYNSQERTSDEHLCRLLKKVQDE